MASHLPIARENGSVELVQGTEISFRELLASSSLGLIEGARDKAVCPSRYPSG
jgi:hypothetical protein